MTTLNFIYSPLERGMSVKFFKKSPLERGQGVCLFPVLNTPLYPLSGGDLIP